MRAYASCGPRTGAGDTRGTLEEPMAGEKARPSEMNVVRLDVPFLTLTGFFIKASFAAALATVVTSVIWIVIWVAMITVTFTLLTALGLGAAAVGGAAAPSAPPALHGAP
jgi:hypothetical protein